MFQRIVIPLDGSIRAERAIPVAARIAQASGGSVILARVVSPCSSLWPSGAEHTPLALQVLAAHLAEAESYLADLATSAELEGIPTERVIQLGPTASTILMVADASQADLIVLCSHGYSGITRRIMGSVAEKLTQEACVPILVLREDGPVPGKGDSGTTRPLRAMVPLDGSVHAEAALSPAAYLLTALAGSAPGVLHLVRIVQPVTTDIEEGGMLTASAKALSYLSETAEHILAGFIAPAVRQLHLDITWSVAVDTYVAETLIRTAEHARPSEGEEMLRSCDLIALATYGRDGLQRWVMGNITQHALGDTQFPLLVVPLTMQMQQMPARNERTEEEETPIEA